MTQNNQHATNSRNYEDLINIKEKVLNNCILFLVSIFNVESVLINQYVPETPSSDAAEVDAVAVLRMR